MSDCLTVLGLDLSLAATGAALVDNLPGGRTETHLIESKGHNDDTLHLRKIRLGIMRASVLGVLPQRTGLVMIEGPSYASKGGKAHDRSGYWWAVVDMLLDLGHKVVEVSPSQRMLYATGKGRADKDVVLAAAVKRYPDVDITNNNVADAVLLAGMGRRRLGAPIDDMPQAHWRALDKIAWPT